MSRRSEWRDVRRAMAGAGSKIGKTVEEREIIPEKACGVCRNFSENAKDSDGRGSCGVLKMGSKINADPPKLVTEGEVGLITFINIDGAKCEHFGRMPFIDTDGGETADPTFRRAHRQMEKI